MNSIEKFLHIIRSNVQPTGNLSTDAFEFRIFTDNEQHAISRKFGSLSPFSQLHSGKIYCFETKEDTNRGSLLDALLLLEHEVQAPFAVSMSYSENEVSAGGRGWSGTVPDLGSYLIHDLRVDRQTPVNRKSVDALTFLSKFDLSNDIIYKNFLDAWRVRPNSLLRFAGFVFLVEGLVGPTSDVKRVADNIASKMSYFYAHIWPNLEASQHLSLPHRNGKDIADVAQLWHDFYKIRNHIAHGGLTTPDPSNGQGVSAARWKPDALGVLQEDSLADVMDILLLSVKHLIYWSLENPGEINDFRKIC